jgi:hypothetical protein
VITKERIVFKLEVDLDSLIHPPNVDGMKYILSSCKGREEHY